MDPITAALMLANTIAEIWKATIEGAAPEQRKELVAMQIEDMKAWREFLKPMIAAFAHKPQETENVRGINAALGDREVEAVR